MNGHGPCEIVLLSSGHPALDQRVFDKEAITLAKSFPRVRVVATHATDEMHHGITITGLPPFRSRFERFIIRPIQCYVKARGQGRRLLILQDAELLPWAPLVKALTGWQIIYDVHEDYPELIFHRTWIPMALRKVISRLVGCMEKSCSGCCDGVIGATQVLTDYFKHPHRVALYNLPSRRFVDEVAGQAKSMGRRTYDLLHLGTLSEEGRLEFLCDVLDGLFAGKADARVLIIGVRPDQQEFVRQRYPEERVTVMGKVDYSLIPGYLGDSKIGINIHPSLLQHLRCAVPVKVFEYMAGGCNIVTSYLPELHRLLGPEGAEHLTTIYAPDPEQFTTEILRLLHEPDSLTRHQVALMRQARQRFNWDREAEKLEQFVSSILQGTDVSPYVQVCDH